MGAVPIKYSWIDVYEIRDGKPLDINAHTQLSSIGSPGDTQRLANMKSEHCGFSNDYVCANEADSRQFISSNSIMSG